MANPEEVNNLKEQIGVYLRDGIIDAREEFRIMVTGKEAGLDLMEIIEIVTQVENDLGLGHQNSALLHLKARAQQFLDNDGVIDTNEMFFLQEIAREKGINDDQLKQVISGLQQKNPMGKKSHRKSKILPIIGDKEHHRSFTALKWVALIVFGLLGLWFSKPAPAPKPHTTEGDIIERLKQVPVKDLVTHKFRFHVVTAAKKEKGDNVILSITSGGFLGSGKTTAVLLEGGVDVNYGVELDINENSCKVDGNAVILSLPAPKTIGEPIVLDKGDSKMQIVDSSGDETISLSENLIIPTIIKDAKCWPEKFELNKIAEQRAKLVLESFIKTFSTKNPEILFSSSSMDCEQEKVPEQKQL